MPALPACAGHRHSVRECAWQESNLRPCAPEAHALSPELQAREAFSLAPMEVTARSVSLELAETFVIARESADTADVVQVEIRHEGVSGFGEGAPIERYGESAESALQYIDEVGDTLGDDPFALEEIEGRLEPREW